jgi:hypothetical protein
MMSARCERSILLTCIAISCTRTNTQGQKSMLIHRSARRTEGVPDIVRRSLAICQIPVSYRERNYTKKRCVPSITTSILLIRPWTMSSVWATVTFDSSPVSRSSRWRTDSISSSPRSFFAYFSAICKSWATLGQGKLTQFSFIHLFSRESENRYQFSHNFYDHSVIARVGSSNLV